ncbi:MAG: glycosyltransferase family 39 protein, partial [Chloroflexota bacterium]|nr:glycosyltransferase family 39 protein [Chloroflexota bacterium]
MRKHQLAAVLLLLCLFAQTLGHARNASITFDEGPHLAVGYATLRTGDLRLQPVHIHPPLANVMAAAPLLLQTDLPDPRSVGGWEIASLSAVTDTVIWQYPHPRRLAMASRYPIILMTLLLGSVIFRWASDLFGPRAGLVALGLYTFDPNIIAHGSLVTTDMAVTLWGTAALFLVARYMHRPRWGYWAGAGVVLGLALASKVSALSLLPPVGLLYLLGPRSLPWRRRFCSAIGCMVLAALTLWAAYGFEIHPLPDFPLPVPAATHLAIYRSLQEHYQLGHPAFLMGQNSEHGWWYYFPIAFILKTPLPTLLLLAVSVISILHSPFSNLHSPTSIRRWGPLLLYPALYIVSSLFSSVNIGYRHLLPLLPLLFILISRITLDASRFKFDVSRLTFDVSRFTFDVSRFTSDASRLTLHASRFTLYASLSWLFLSTLRLSPNYLACFNLLAGGPAGGYRYLVDSNLDWGQNLYQLRDWMEENGVEHVYYAHFSPDRPQVYGINADFLPPDPRAVEFAPLDPDPGVYAIGATVLQGAYTPDVDTYAWFRSYEPVTRLGHALFVYDVPQRSLPAWAAICADPTPVLSPGAVRTGFGRSDMRVILLDCGQSWIYPAGGDPGGYVLPPGTESPPGATLEVAARYPDGNPFYDVYRVEGKGLLPRQPIEGITLDGPLAFLGYQVDVTSAHPGETIELWTFWKVKVVPARPLSLMAHLVGPEGAPVAVGDGLGIPVDQWQPGDVIVQRHPLQIAERTPEGEYYLQIGAYWLDTMERWTAQMGDGTSSDRVILE